MYGGHDPSCREALDYEECKECGCTRRAHGGDGCYSHGCTAMVALWFRDRRGLT